MDDTKIIADNIVRYRTQKGWSRSEFQRQLAETSTPIGIMPLRQIEAGKRDLRLPEALTIAKMFDIPVEFLAIDRGKAGSTAGLDSIVTFAAAQAAQAAQAARAAASTAIAAIKDTSGIPGDADQTYDREHPAGTAE